MPRYFFDRTDNGTLTRDEVGIELADDEAARRHVGTVLPDLAHDGPPDGDVRTFGCSVRERKGDVIYEAELTYHGRRLGSRRAR